MIIELFGYPGSGKTYAIQQVIGNNSTNVSTGYWNKKFGMFFKKLAIWMPESIILRRKIRQLIKGINTHPIFFERKKNKYINNLALLAFGYHWAGKKNIYMDEGIVQRVVAFAVNYGMSAEQMLSLLNVFKKYIEKATVIYYDVEMTVCLNSIKIRNRHQCEMDTLDDSRLYYFMQCYAFYFNVINLHYRFIRCTRHDICILKNITP